MVFRIPVQLIWTNAPGGPGVNVFHARGEVAEGAEEVINLLQTFYEAVDIVIPTGVTMTFDGTYYGDIETGSPSYQTAEPWSVPGAGGAAYAPMPTALAVGWFTSVATRSGRGRTFLGPMGAGAVETNGTPTSAALAVVRTAADALVDASSGLGNGALGVWSPTDGVIRDVVQARVRDQFAVLRSRRQ